ncbi:hypothetical protein AVEN_130304-1 [Araneus ventricosus]|uniref:Uncharacterized protein n=1 Tax=Araneus ventricosus TaxID=182803 RepID=A0A4Y2BDQ4_ARAVE|nr:hypothetical protein AVEN_130304-1 [Araneus ventricosus]
MVDLAHSKRFRGVKKEDHYSLIQEPGSVYIGHVAPTSGSSEDSVTSIISYLSGHGISLEKLVAIGCDGTAINTDGKSTGPKSLRGPIGEKLKVCEKRPVIGFKSIDCQIPTIDRSILSKDQQYLLDIAMAIKSGNCKEDLTVPDPGPLTHSRWLTTVNRTLRLYLNEESPTPELQEIAVFILKSYMPMWFSIETSKYLTEGPKLVYQTI